jgi:hypothetical protein
MLWWQAWGVCSKLTSFSNHLRLSCADWIAKVVLCVTECVSRFHGKIISQISVARLLRKKTSGGPLQRDRPRWRIILRLRQGHVRPR